MSVFRYELPWDLCTTILTPRVFGKSDGGSIDWTRVTYLVVHANVLRECERLGPAHEQAHCHHSANEEEFHGKFGVNRLEKQGAGWFHFPSRTLRSGSGRIQGETARICRTCGDGPSATDASRARAFPLAIAVNRVPRFYSRDQS